jgi:AcrR family transcriptional regulator
MFHKGLNKEIVIETAKELIEEVGYNDFSMRKLADKLEVKTASLYTHIESMEALFTEVGLSALKEQRNCLLHTIGEKKGDDAVKALAVGYRCFSMEHPALYQIIMQMPSGDNEVLKKAAAMTAEPFMQVLGNYQISEEQKMHWQRVMRGIMHGFASEEQAGYFSHYPVAIEESYKVAINCMIDGLHREESGNYDK